MTVTCINTQHVSKGREHDAVGHRRLLVDIVFRCCVWHCEALTRSVLNSIH